MASPIGGGWPARSAQDPVQGEKSRSSWPAASDTGLSLACRDSRQALKRRGALEENAREESRASGLRLSILVPSIHRAPTREARSMTRTRFVVLSSASASAFAFAFANVHSGHLRSVAFVPGLRQSCRSDSGARPETGSSTPLLSSSPGYPGLISRSSRVLVVRDPGARLGVFRVEPGSPRFDPFHEPARPCKNR